MTSYATSKEAAGALTPETPGEYLEKRTLPLQDVNSLDYDCDSLSDGREKTDTTPENLKKIDDVIESSASVVVVDSLRSHFWSHPSVVVATAAAATNITEPVLRVDESDRKLDMDKTLRLRSANDTLCKRDRIESTTNATPLTDTSTTTTNSIINSVDESSIDSTSTTATKQSFAFTIDNFNDKDCDPAAAQAKYKSMLERFQQRHRRGASMSKLENSSVKETLTTSTSAATLSKSINKSLNAENCDNLASSNGGNTGTASPPSIAAKVKLRPRDRSTSRVRDASKRHSWSPRSSTSELTTPAPTTTVTTTNKTSQSSSTNSQQSKASRQEAMPPQSIRKNNAAKAKPQFAQMHKTSSTAVPARQQFTPRSTAMQLALQKVDFMCAQPPLADFKHLHSNEADNISETGTYTLDGDNYTEEQKDLMNIDKSTLERAQKARRAAQAALNRPTDLELSKIPATAASAATVGSRHNVLEINYFHEPESTPRVSAPNDYLLGNNQSASSYLEKIKSRVLRNMTVTKNSAVQDLAISKMLESSSSSCTGGGCAGEKTPSSADVGTFTSVTTSGVLAKQCALDARPKLTRRSSLSTSQIDSSEYVSNESKLKQSGAAAYAAGGFTDHQKAEYRLNVFTNQKDTHTFSGPSRSFIQTPPDSPTVYKAAPSNLSDAAVLKTAQNKNDWIQEWARNARARSLASCDSTKSRQQLQTQELMTRSYTCSETGGESLNDDSVFHAQRPPAGFSNKTLASRYRLVSGEFDYASDPALSSSFTAKSSAETPRPPKSPSKIPSPLHSLGRARSASRTRASLQNMLQMEAAEADSYLQKTAAAINNLQQSFSRKNSLQSPHSGSPRAAHSKKSSGGNGAYFSPDENSPQHSLESPTAGSSYQQAVLRNAHKRNLSMDIYNRDAHAQIQLMTSSFNEQQLQLLTGSGGGGDYMQRSRGRKNSYDGNMQLVLPNSPVGRRDNWTGAPTARESKIPEQHEQSEPNSMSPLRRSSSFSAKVAGKRAARPQFQNLYTPPAARHNYVPPGGCHQPALMHAIKKSASSNNFGNVYSDYDENLAYYIKDEDEYGGDDDGNEYYSSDEEFLDQEDYRYHHLEPNLATSDSRNESSEANNVPLSNTRYNKALLMRIERSKQKVAGGGKSSGAVPSSASSAKAVLGAGAGGVAACPNTPELPRRNIKSAPRSNAARQSMPRDSSLNRLAGQIPNSLASAKKQLLQTAAAVPNKTTTASGVSTRVQPKYLDISKYKPVQGNNFLRKNDAKSTLKPGLTETMKRSPSSSSMGLSRGDPTRASNRSAKSATSVMTTSGTTLSARAASAVRRDASVAKQKEAEMAMWKRRSKYDPMKAAAEDRRKKEEAKRMAQPTNDEFVNESANQSNTYQRQTSCDNQWTLGLHEAGDEELSD